jgi:hypothetical protein
METKDELSWEKLKRALLGRYGGRRLENPFEELSTLTQKGSVEIYFDVQNTMDEMRVKLARLSMEGSNHSLV